MSRAIRRSLEDIVKARTHYMNSDARVPDVTWSDLSKRPVESFHLATEVMLKGCERVKSVLSLDIWVPRWAMPIEEAEVLGLLPKRSHCDFEESFQCFPFGSA